MRMIWTRLVGAAALAGPCLYNAALAQSSSPTSLPPTMPSGPVSLTDAFGPQLSGPPAAIGIADPSGLSFGGAIGLALPTGTVMGSGLAESDGLGFASSGARSAGGLGGTSGISTGIGATKCLGTSAGNPTSNPVQPYACSGGGGGGSMGAGFSGGAAASRLDELLDSIDGLGLR